MTALSLIVLTGVLLPSGLVAADTAKSDYYWSVLNSAIQSGGPSADSVFALLGTIDDEKARTLLHTTLGTAGGPIEYAVSGLTPDECRLYLQDLRHAALDPAIPSKLGVLAAIARAGTPEAVEALLEVANEESQPSAGVAFGLLERMGSLAEPALKKEAANGPSPWSRETAASTLDRMRARGAASVFKADIHDANRDVRVAGALGLAHLGHPDGRAILESVARENDSSYQWDALVALADLGQADAFREITSVLNDSDEGTKGRLVWAIARSGNASLKALAYRLRLPARPEFLAMLAERMLQPSDPQDLSVLKDALARCNEAVGMIAAEKLMHTRFREDAEKAVMCGISSMDVQVRGLAVDLASRDSMLWPHLVNKINDPDPAVQTAALTAIERLDQKDRFKDVERYITSENWQVALTAAKVLAALEPAEARSVFEQALNSGHGNERILSAAMLLRLSR